MTLVKRQFISIAAVCLALTFTKAHVDEADAEVSAGQTMEGHDRDYPYLIVDQAVADTLREFGHNHDIAVEVSTRIKGRVRRYQHSGSSGEFLNYLASEHGLDWVFDRGRLFITSVDEQVDRSWSAGVGGFEAAKAALDDAGIDDPRYPVGYDRSQGMLRLSAPPRYMALAAPVIDRVLAPKVTHTVNVIHGRARNGGT